MGSLETPSENDLISKFLTDNDLPYIWTSGRLCNFKGCDREDLQPTNVNGRFWSGSGVKMAPTNSTPPGWSYQPWSFTGHKTQFEGKNVSQPDNAEFDINGSVEACMGLLNDIYDDGLNGTISPATTPSPSSARTPTSYLNTSRPLAQIWNSKEISPLLIFNIESPDYLLLLLLI